MSSAPPVRPVDAVVLGGSAGAVEVLLAILPGLPARCPYAVIVLVHLPQDAPGVLAGVLGGRCALPVREPDDKEKVAPGTVWVAPAGYHLLVERDRTFALSVDAPVLYSRPSIDVLLESCAAAYGARVCAAVLSGANADGAAGLAAIARAGGIPLVQDPATAGSGEMPRAALAAAPACPLPVGALRGYLGKLATVSA